MPNPRGVNQYTKGGGSKAGSRMSVDRVKQILKGKPARDKTRKAWAAKSPAQKAASQKAGRELSAFKAMKRG